MAARSGILVVVAAAFLLLAVVSQEQDGPFTVDVTADANNQVNVSTGVTIDELLGAMAPAASKTKEGEAASGPAGSGNGAAPTGARAVGWSVAGMAVVLGYYLF